MEWICIPKHTWTSVRLATPFFPSASHLLARLCWMQSKAIAAANISLLFLLLFFSFFYSFFCSLFFSLFYVHVHVAMGDYKGILNSDSNWNPIRRPLLKFLGNTAHSAGSAWIEHGSCLHIDVHSLGSRRRAHIQQHIESAA